MDLARFGARFGLHPPKTASSVNVAAIGDKKYLGPVGCPGRADFMINLTVVVTRQAAAIFSGQTLHVLQLAICEISDEEVKVSVERSGNEGHPLPVGREARLNINRTSLRELPGTPGFQVQRPKF